MAQPNDWVDVTDWQDVDEQSALSMTPGRGTMPGPSGTSLPLPGMPRAPMPPTPEVTKFYEAQEANPLNRGVKSALSQLNPLTMLSNFKDATAAAVYHPVDTWRKATELQGDQFRKATDDYSKGKYLDMARHGAASVLPMLGPQVLGDMGDRAQTDQWPEAVGEGVGLGISMFGPQALTEAARNMRIRGPLRNVNTPRMEEALTSVESDVPMTAGQRSGNRALMRVEQGLENAPMSSGRVHQFANDQVDALARKGRGLAAQSGTQTNNYGAGTSILNRGQERISRLKNYADQRYAEVRQAFSSNPQSVNVARAGTAPNYQTLDTPIDLGPIRAQLQPVYDDIKNLMPTAQQGYDKSFTALRHLMESDSQYMPAVDFDKNLGAVKAMLRDGSSPYLTSRSQGLAAKVVRSAEDQLSATLPSDVLSKLQQARKAVVGYYRTAEAMDALGTEPASIYKNLTSGGDVVLNQLRDLNKFAPKEVQTIGRTFLEDLLDKATAEGGFAKADSVYNAWSRMGPETKTLLYGPRADEIDKFFLASKRLTKNLNPSGTASMNATIGGLGEAGAAMWALLNGSPYTAAGIAAGAPATRALTELLLRPGGYKLLTQGVSIGAPMTAGLRGVQAGAFTSGMPSSKFADPFAAVTPEQKSKLLQQLRFSGDKATLDVDGNKMMWQMSPDGRTIRRLR